MDRNAFAAQIEAVGISVNGLREDALAAGWVFVAGLLRGVEEVLLVAHNLLLDADGDQL